MATDTKDNKIYLLKVTGRQLAAIDKSLDITTRMHAGQLDRFLEGFIANLIKNNKVTSNQYYSDLRDDVDSYLAMIKRKVNLVPGESMGIGRVSETDKIAYDLYKVIRKMHCDQDPEATKHSVYQYPVEPLSKEPLMEIEVTTNLKRKLNTLLKDKK